jgi:hypothetical protein
MRNFLYVHWINLFLIFCTKSIVHRNCGTTVFFPRAMKHVVLFNTINWHFSVVFYFTKNHKYPTKHAHKSSSHHYLFLKKEKYCLLTFVVGSQILNLFMKFCGIDPRIMLSLSSFMLKRNIFIICVIYLIFNIIFSLYKYFNNKSTIIRSVFLSLSISEFY